MFTRLRNSIPASLQSRWNWKIFLVIGLAIGLGGYLFLQSRADEEISLTFEQPQRESLTKTLDISGVVDAKEKARMRFLSGGKVVYLGAKTGDWVERWQTIAQVDARTLQKQQDKDLNNYMVERWDWENTQDDIKDKALETSERREVEQEQFMLNNTVLDVEIRDIAIQETGLYAPFAGVLTSSPADVAGVQLAPTDYFEIVNPNTIVFRAAVDEVDIAEVALGQEASIELDAYEGEKYQSSISYISYTSSDSSTGTVFIIEMPLTGYGMQTFRLGMNGDVSIILETIDDTLTIPLIATRERDNKVFVDVKTGENEYEEREITVGLETDETVEVLDGLSEEDWVLIPE